MKNIIIIIALFSTSYLSAQSSVTTFTRNNEPQTVSWRLEGNFFYINGKPLKCERAYNDLAKIILIVYRPNKDGTTDKFKVLIWLEQPKVKEIQIQDPFGKTLEYFKGMSSLSLSSLN